MTMIYYADATSGVYLGGVGVDHHGNVAQPPHSIEVPPPADRRDIWDAVAQAWIPYAEPVQYPTLTPRQLRLMLLNIGITETQVDAEIGAIADPVEQDASRIEWKYASAYERDHPLIDQMATAFSLPPAQVDTLWLAAADL